MTKPGGTAYGAGGRSSAIIDTVQRQSADRLAKVAFIWVWAILTPSITVVAAAITNLVLAAVIGLAGGFATACVVGVVVLIWPGLRMVWYWAAETTLLVLVLAAYLGLTRLLPWWAALVVLVAVLATPWAIPTSRRLLTAWIWCAISRHRLRVAFATFIRVNRRGSLPLILWAHPTLAGERIWIFLRPGLSLEDMGTEGGLDRLATACWAKEVKLHRASRRNAARLRVDITRRNPLGDTIASPLAHLVPDLGLVDDDTLTDELSPVDVAGLDLPGVPDQPDPAPTFAGSRPASASRSKPTATRTTPRKPAPDQAVVTPNGEDLSDWV